MRYASGMAKGRAWGWLFAAVFAMVLLPMAVACKAGKGPEKPVAAQKEPEKPVAAQKEPEKPVAAEKEPVGEPGVPQIVRTSPSIGATDVDPATTAIVVTFNTDMGGGFSWTGGGPNYPKGREGMRPHWRDKRTCVFPVTLEKASYYRIGINSKSFQNFRSAAGAPVRPSAIYFTTQGASEELKARVRKPTVVKMEPPNGAKDVDPNLSEIRVTFSMPMGGGFHSWTGGGPTFPAAPEGKRPVWSEDRKTCIRPVQLKPNSTYRMGLNSPSAINFMSEWGVSLDPVVYTFQTR